MNENRTDTNKELRLALLIDGDNAQASILPRMLAEIGKHGSITIRRIYGDWTTSSMNSWKEALHHHAIQPVQQFRYTVGKNATDSALIIDAMDILHRRLVDGFCIVSSDSDYTRMATRIREEGMFIMGIGKKTTPKAFVNGCDLFIYTENIAPTRERESRSKEQRKSKAPPKKSTYASSDPLPLLREGFDMVVQEDGWASLGQMGKALLQLDPGFDPRTFGYKQLSQLIKAHPNDFELKHLDENTPSNVFVRLRGGASTPFELPPFPF